MKIRKLRNELEEPERPRREGLEKRGKGGGATEGGDEVGERSKPADKTACNQAAGNGATGERERIRWSQAEKEPRGKMIYGNMIDENRKLIERGRARGS